MDPRVVQIIDLKMRSIFAMMNYNHDFASHWKAIAGELKKGGREEKEDNFRILLKFFERLLKKSHEEMEPEDYAKLKRKVLETFEFSTDKQYLGRKMRKDWVDHLNKIGGKVAGKPGTRQTTLGGAKKKTNKDRRPNWFEEFVEKYALWIAGACAVLIFLIRSFSQ